MLPPSQPLCLRVHSHSRLRVTAETALDLERVSLHNEMIEQNYHVRTINIYEQVNARYSSLTKEEGPCKIHAHIEVQHRPLPETHK